MNRQNCVYRDTSNRIEDLEETQMQLEERLLELEGPSSSVLLTDPFASSSKLFFFCILSRSRGCHVQISGYSNGRSVSRLAP